MKGTKMFRSITFYLLLFLLSISLVNYLQLQYNEPNQIYYSTFLNYVDQRQIASVKVMGDTQVSGELKDGTKFQTTVPSNSNDIWHTLRTQGVQVEMQQDTGPAWYVSLLSTLLPILLIIGVFLFFMQQSQGSGNKVMQFGKSRARMHTADEKQKVTFADVAGIDEVKEELEEVVDFLKHPKRYAELGARIPKGVLLFGAPGTGKTLLARAVAGEAGVPFFDISGSDFVEMFVGVGASRVRDLFDQAKKNAPCIVFIDEIDAVGRQRGAGYGGGHDEREQTLNQLLVEMDGFGTNEGIILMAATNRPDVLDPALLRPGRFDRQVVIDKPDLGGREAILRVHSKNKPLEDNVDLSVLARRTPGFTGADIENLVNEAALLAARQKKRTIGMEEFELAIDRVLTGGPEKKTRAINEKEKQTIAYHEAGHALIGHLLPNTDPVHKISIIPRGSALGYTLQLPIEDRYLVTKGEIVDRIATYLGGRAAEELVLGEISTGAHDDLEKATKLVRRMITEFGMSEKLGPRTFGSKQDNPFLGRDIARERDYSEEVAAAIDREVSEQIANSYNIVKDMLIEHRGALDEIAKQLIEKESLEGKDLDTILEKVDGVA